MTRARPRSTFRRPVLAPAAVLLALSALLASGCASVQAPLRVEAVSAQARADLVELELELLEARIVAERIERLRGATGIPAVSGATVPAAGSDAAELERLNLELANLLDASRRRLAALEPKSGEAAAVRGASPAWYGALEALRGERALLAADRKTAEAALQAALALAPDSELALLLRSRLAADPEARLVALEKALPIADGAFRLEVERGSALLALGRGAEALAAFDSSFPFLPEPWARLRMPERDRAWALREGPAGGGALAALGDGPSTWPAFAALLRERSTLLDAFPGAEKSDAAALDALGKAGMLPSGLDPVAVRSASAEPPTRAEAAFVLWRLVMRTRPEQLDRYSKRYAGRKSPIGDVPTGHPSFDAVLGLVELEVVELPDGRDFIPDAYPSGYDLDRWIRAADKAAAP